MLVYWIWLSLLAKVSVRQKLLLLQKLRDPEEIYLARPELLRQIEGLTQQTLSALEDRDLSPARAILRQCSEKSISILTYGDAAYPNKLKRIEHPPLVLYYRGCLPDWDSRPVIGVVGTRKASPYGLSLAGKIGCELAAGGALVVSGGAEGIDARALSGAMQSGKPVVAVLGFGADVCFPAKHRPFFADIADHGCLITEYPPETPAYRWNFLARNRIISGLSDGVLVVEAPQKSGALNTAGHAADQGRDIFAVPGNAQFPGCAGSNGLLQQGAIPAESGWDILKEYQSLYPDTVCEVTPDRGIFPEKSAVSPARPVKNRKDIPEKCIDNPGKSQYIVLEAPTLSPDEQAVFALLTETPVTVDHVIDRADMPANRVLSILTMLAMKGVVVNHPGKRVSKK